MITLCPARVLKGVYSKSTARGIASNVKGVAVKWYNSSFNIHMLDRGGGSSLRVVRFKSRPIADRAVRAKDAAAGSGGMLPQEIFQF